MAHSRRRAETRARLFAAALTLIRKGTLGSASVESLSELAGFTRGAFYSNFASMDDLLLGLFEQRLDELVPLTDPAEPDPADTATQDRILAGVAKRLVSIPWDRDWFLLVRDVTAIAARRPENATSLVAFRARLRQRTTSILTSEFTTIGLRATLDMDLLATATIAIVEAWQERTYLEDIDQDLATANCVATVTALLLSSTESVGPAES